MRVTLRAVRSSDLPVFFEHQVDRQAADLAGHVPRGRAAFDEHWGKIVGAPDTILRTVEVDGRVAGYVGAFSREGRPEIAYWFGREHWGRGVGRGAVSRFLALHRERPIFGCVAVENAASVSILRSCGFETIAEDVGPDGRAEYLLRLD